MRFDVLAARLRETEPRPLVVVGGAEENLLEAVTRAERAGLARVIVLGDRQRIVQVAHEHGLDLGQVVIQHEPDDEQAVRAGMAIVREEERAVLMKGTLSTPTLMRTAMREGLRVEGRLLTHIAAFEHSRFERLLLLSDSGVVPYPTLEQRMGILRNAIRAARAIGVPRPNVALLSANEEVDEKFPCSVDYARLCEAVASGALKEAGSVFGPVDLFSALDPDIARKKGLDGPGMGLADVLHCPDVVSGNLLGKSIVFFGGDVRTGGCIVGGAAPVVLLSRASSPEDKYCSIVLGLSTAGAV